MSTYPIAWSHSRVKTYLDCPRMFYEQNIAKSVTYEQGAPQIEGERVHKALEKRLIHKVTLGPKEAYLEPMMQVIERMPGQTFGERDYCLNSDLRPTGYFAKDAFCRVTVDVTNIDVPRKWGWLGDYKNGKVTVDDDQLMLYAAVGFIFFPEIDTFKTDYIFLQHKLPMGKTYTRAQLPDMWRQLLQVPVAMQRAAETNQWPTRPSRKCGYCSVNKAGKCPDAGEAYRGS